MKLMRIVTLLMLVLLPFSATAQQKTGEEIIDEVTERHARPFEFEIQRVTLIDNSGSKQIRDLKRYARTVGEGENRYLMVFHSPPGIRGAALVTWQRKFKDDGQWIYLPANGQKPIRIIKGGKKNYVMGTDYTAEDLMPESTDKVSYERRRDEAIAGKPHFVVDVTPRDRALAKASGYKYRRLWISKDNYFIMRTDYYDKRNKLIKRQTASDVSRVEDDMWRAATLKMENFKLDHSTRIEVLDRKFDESSVPKEIFFERTLMSGKHVR